MLAQVLDPYVVAFNGIPRIALAPLFIIWFGIGPMSKVILVISVVFFLTFFNTFAGVKGVDAELKNILRIMGASERQILMKVTLPAIVPWITHRSKDQFTLRHRRRGGRRVHRGKQRLGLSDQLQYFAVFDLRRVGRHLRSSCGGSVVQRSDHQGRSLPPCAGGRGMNAKTRANSINGCARMGHRRKRNDARRWLARRSALHKLRHKA